MILSLQGCMAVGKTTAIEYLQKNASYINVSYEDNRDVILKIKEKKLDKNKHEDYLKIQKLWIEKEIMRYNQAKQYNCSIMDFGSEEIEFYTLNYPRSIQQNWQIEKELKNELEALRRCMPTRILFLDASVVTLKAHKENDTNRSRHFFEHYLKYLLPLKRQWFLNKDNVDILKIDGLTKEEVGQKVKEWVDFCILNY